MSNSIIKGFIAGALGAAILAIIMYILKGAGMGEPGFVNMYRGMFKTNDASDHVLGGLIFIISGGIWGVVYTLLVKRPTILNGLLFGFLPTLWLWVVVNGVLGKPLFNNFDPKGIIMPLVFNMVIWGSFIGWYLSKKNSRLAAV